jgi:hypothetical protein
VRRKTQDNPLVAVSSSSQFDPRGRREANDVIEERWRTVWAPRFNLPAVFTGYARFQAMTKVTTGFKRVRAKAKRSA